MQHRRRRLLDLAVLPLRRLEQPVRDRLRFLRRLRHLVGRRVDAAHQRAQLLDREVDRVGDRAGHVLGHRRLHGEVAVGEVAHLVQQPQDRFLVALVLVLAVLRAQRARRRGTPCAISARQPSASSANAIARPSVKARVRLPPAAYWSASVVVSVEQRLGLVVDAARRLLGDDEVRHVRQDRVDAGLVAGEALAELGRASRARRRRAPARGAAHRCPSRDRSRRRETPRRPCRAGTRLRDRSRRRTRACWRSSRSAATARRAGSRNRLRAGCRRPGRSAAPPAARARAVRCCPG